MCSTRRHQGLGCVSTGQRPRWCMLEMGLINLPPLFHWQLLIRVVCYVFHILEFKSFQHQWPPYRNQQMMWVGYRYHRRPVVTFYDAPSLQHCQHIASQQDPSLMALRSLTHTIEGGALDQYCFQWGVLLKDQASFAPFSLVWSCPAKLW